MGKLFISEEIFENELIQLQLKFLRTFGIIQPTKAKNKFLRRLFGFAVLIQLIIMGLFKCYLLVTKFKGFAALGLAECSIFLYMIDIFTILHTILNVERYQRLVVKIYNNLLQFKNAKLSPETEIYTECVTYIKSVTKRLVLPTYFCMIVISTHSFYYAIFDTKNYNKTFMNEIYPFTEYIPNYILLCIIQTMGMLSSILFILMWQTFIAGLMTYPIFRLRILNNRWNNYRIKNNEEFSNFVRNQIEDHNFIISTIREIECLMTPHVFAEFLIFSMVLCFLMYQLASDNSSIFVFVMIFYTQAVLRILYVYYHQGQIIYDLTNETTVAMYSLNWYELDKRGKQLILIALRATHDPILMKAYILRLNHQTFLEILKTSYSYFNLLTTMSDK